MYHIKLNKKLMKELEEWRYELAYFTEETVATPKGVRKFIEKNFMRKSS